VINAFRGAEIRLGARVLILGLGPIGIAAAVLTELWTGRAATAVDRAVFRCDLARQIARCDVINVDISATTIGDCVESLSPATNGRGYDVIVEAAGVPGACLPQLIDILSENGRLIYLARAGQQMRINADTLVSKALTVRGSRGPNGGAILEAIEVIDSCYDQFSRLITSRVGFDDIASVLTSSDYLAEGKVVFRPHLRVT
jgi:threonine dehydrogenase-like Zn-dependent dehydrogenase